MHNIDDHAAVTIAIRERPLLPVEISKGCIPLSTEHDKENKASSQIKNL